MRGFTVPFLLQCLTALGIALMYEQMKRWRRRIVTNAGVITAVGWI